MMQMMKMRPATPMEEKFAKEIADPYMKRMQALIDDEGEVTNLELFRRLGVEVQTKLRRFGFLPSPMGLLVEIEDDPIVDLEDTLLFLQARKLTIEIITAMKAGQPFNRNQDTQDDDRKAA